MAALEYDMPHALAMKDEEFRAEDDFVDCLRGQLAIHFGRFEGIEDFLEFRVNFNEIEPTGLTWEGFDIATGEWHLVKPHGRLKE